MANGQHYYPKLESISYITNRNTSSPSIVKNLRIIPNPSSQIIKLTFKKDFLSKDLEKVRMVVTHIQDMTILDQLVNPFAPINIEKLKPGMYVIKYKTKRTKLL